MLTRLPEESLALIAELVDRARALAAAERDLPSGTFVAKAIKGQKYWYLQTMGAGIRNQRYLGPETGELLARIQAIKEAREELEPDRQRLQRLNDALIATGAVSESPYAVRALELLSEAGFFRAGAVLAGTRAFTALMTQLGYRYSALTKTQDIDVLLDQGIALAFPRDAARELPSLLDGEDGPFMPVPELHPGRPSTSFRIRGHEMRVDFLTPLRGRTSEKPIVLHRLGLAATPLRDLDYLLTDVQDAVVVGSRPVLVRVPHAGRFALHKLAISARRALTDSARAAKDRQQAAAILGALLEDRPGELSSALKALRATPRLLKAVKTELPRLPPELASGLAGLSTG